MKTMYHCLYNEPAGSALRATCERDLGELKGTFLFAATHLTKSLAFAFSYHDGEVFSNGGIKGTDNEWVMLMASKKPLEKERSITVLSFDGEGFIELEGQRQAVSREDLPFSKTSLHLQTTDYRDLMREGLQILIFDDVNHPDAIGDNYMDDFTTSGEFFAHLMKAGALRWVNRDENINPCQQLHRNISQAGQTAPTEQPTALIIK